MPIKQFYDLGVEAVSEPVGPRADAGTLRLTGLELTQVFSSTENHKIVRNSSKKKLIFLVYTHFLSERWTIFVHYGS